MPARWLAEDGGPADCLMAVSLGGNLGGTEAVIARFQRALAALETRWGRPRISSYYRTAPLGPVQEQPDFVNAVAAFCASPPVSPEAALEALQGLEGEAGRQRLLPGGARTLDLDLLFVGRERRQTAELTLPHPRMHERAFVLQPLRELFGSDFFWTARGPRVGECLARAEVREQACQTLFSSP